MSTATTTSSITHEPAELLRIFRDYIPKLDGSSIKGDHGRIAIIGGSQMYTGAPYFAGISSMRAGGDLCSIYTAPSASVSLKAMSPDLMVVPTLSIPDDVNAQAIAIGPGLGRDASVLPEIMGAIKIAQRRDIPLVLDADALYLLTNHGELRDLFSEMDGGNSNNDNVVLTPNVKEFKYVDKVVGRAKFAYISKGATDRICVGGITSNVCTRGSAKRVGGQGDILAGILALFLSWVHTTTGGRNIDDAPPARASLSLARAAAAVAACSVTRHAGYLAFEKHGRSLLTSDIVEEIGRAVAALESGVL